jgi:hypothetical protein
LCAAGPRHLLCLSSLCAPDLPAGCAGAARAARSRTLPVPEFSIQYYLRPAYGRAAVTIFGRTAACEAGLTA